jgi:hypothetical protein
MVSAWRADTKDILPADTTDVFCSSDSSDQEVGALCTLVPIMVEWDNVNSHKLVARVRYNVP